MRTATCVLGGNISCRNWRVFLLLFVFSWNAAIAGTYFVSVGGKPENKGTKAFPWPSVEHALSRVGGGNTIVLLPGLYRGPIEVDRVYAGTLEKPTVIKSEKKWKAVIIGAPYHGISNKNGCDYIIIDGFEVMGARYNGVKLNGDYNTVRNCWIHNNGHMGIGTHGHTGNTIENNLVEFNGQHVQFHHGIYASGAMHTIRGNIVRHNAGYGMHLYSSIEQSVIAYNIVHGHARAPGIIVSCPDGGGQNRIVNNTIAQNHGALTVWNGNGELIANNIFVSDDDVLNFDRCRALVLDRNLCFPKSKQQGENDFNSDPKFLDAERGVFWLKPGSPAIGAGSSRHAILKDFWGRDVRKENVDLGAIPFESVLAKDSARSDWHQQWPYRYAPDEGKEMPDVWMFRK